MRKQKMDNEIKITEEFRIPGTVFVLEEGDRIKVLNEKRVCANYRRDTEQCMTGCSKIGVIKGNMCPFETDLTGDDYDIDDLQMNCPCFR